MPPFSARTAAVLEPNKREIAGPRPGPMIQSLRAVGYDLPTAVADLVDNSISASARNIWIQFHWDGERSHIAIVDDGSGMSESELVAAMRLGSRSPLEERSLGDLGRFGLGLKTASFSQCSRLTVVSRVQGQFAAARCWDLDLVTREDEWVLTDDTSPVVMGYADRLNAGMAGTAVVWELLDRVTPSGLTAGDEHGQRVFLELAEQTKQHLGMVFHRLLTPPRPVKLFLNGVPLKPWDPFLTGKSIQLTEQVIPYAGGRIEVKPYLLPHYSKLTREEYEVAAGPRGWTAQQGFYVYRGRRLLVGGDWLGLGRFQKEEHHKLARIQLDIPNSTDAAWEIDVKKSRACPPPPLRTVLKQIAEAARANASRVYRHRGARVIQANPTQSVPLWDRRVKHGKLSYVLNRSHPLVAEVLEQSGSASKLVRLLLTVVEETVPVPAITVDACENPDSHARPFEHAPEAVEIAARATLSALTSAGHSTAEARVRLLCVEPFSQFPELIASLEPSLDTAPEN